LREFKQHRNSEFGAHQRHFYIAAIPGNNRSHLDARRGVTYLQWRNRRGRQ
jgi:hypothetical protein